MGDKHSLNCEVRELKLGASFTNKSASQYHTIKYDFKPASVDVNKMATVDVGTNNQVTVTVPHLDGSGVPQTVFKGNQRPYTKECVLIIDRVTGEITLEKLSSNIQVKKTRQESVQKPRPLTPVTSDLTNCTQRSTSRTRVATNKRTGHNAVGPAPLSNGAGPAGGAGGAGSASGVGGAGGARFSSASASKPQPQNMVRSPPRQRTSPPQAPWSVGGNSTLASLPMIGFDDTPTPAPAPAPAPATAYVPPPRHERPDRPERHERPDRPERPERPEKSERADRPDRVERNDRYMPERQERPFNSLPSIQQPTVLPAGAMAAVAAEDSSSSSSSSESGSDSGSDSDSDDAPPPAALPHHATNGNVNNISLPSDVLNDDLCLSESGSDFD